MSSASAQSTSRRRSTVWRHWLRFIHEADYSIIPIRPSELYICLWIVWLFKRGLTYGTVRTYLFSLASEIKYRGGSNILSKECNWFIHSTLKHFQLAKGSSPIVYRRPLTVDLLCKVLERVDFSDFDSRVYATMLAVGVFCLLRIGEVCDTRIDGKHKFIRNKDLIFRINHIEFILWRTKTDVEGRGVKKYIAKMESFKWSPFQLVHRLKILKLNFNEPNDPFFVLKSGKVVSRYLLVKFLKLRMREIAPNIDSNEWSGISLRKGGATSAMRAGIPGEIVQKLGNWKSSIYKSYIDHAEFDVSKAQNKMAMMLT